MILRSFRLQWGRCFKLLVVFTILLLYWYIPNSPNHPSKWLQIHLQYIELRYLTQNPYNTAICNHGCWKAPKWVQEVSISLLYTNALKLLNWYSTTMPSISLYGRHRKITVVSDLGRSIYCSVTHEVQSFGGFGFCSYQTIHIEILTNWDMNIWWFLFLSNHSY